MIEITKEELQKNIDKYIELGQKELIKVTNNGDWIFTIVPKCVDLANRWEAIFGTLPREAFEDKDIDRE